MSGNPEGLVKAGAALLAVAAGGKVVQSVHYHVALSSHDRIVKKTAERLEERTVSDATVKVDHIPNVGYDRPREMNGKRPDITLTHFSSSFYAFEVETADSLDSQAKKQLEAFAEVRNYECVLVVPERTLRTGKEFVQNTVNADVTVTTPYEVL
jgi:hypothetical protein